MEKINVIFIGGSGRSGSTVITKIINYWRGFIGLNEVCYLWRYGLDKNYPISNGELFKESTFWKDVLLKVFPNGTIPRNQIDFFSHPNLVGLKNIVRHLLSEMGTDSDTASYIKNIEQLYISIAEVSKAKYIVDSSKTPDYAHFLSSIDRLNIYFIHLVRDPRGVAYSWNKKFRRNDTRGEAVSMTSFKWVESTLRWIKWNIGCELIKRRKGVKYLRVRYEDFVQDPINILGEMTSFVGLDKNFPKDYFTEFGFINKHDAEDISVWGNPHVRNSEGAIKVKGDDQWMKEYSFRKKLMVMLLTFPLLLRYNYSLFPTQKSI